MASDEAMLLAWAFGGAMSLAVAASECEAETVQGRPHRIGWVRLLERVLATT